MNERGWFTERTDNLDEVELSSESMDERSKLKRLTLEGGAAV